MSDETPNPGAAFARIVLRRLAVAAIVAVFILCGAAFGASYLHHPVLLVAVLRGIRSGAGVALFGISVFAAAYALDLR